MFLIVTAIEVLLTSHAVVVYTLCFDDTLFCAVNVILTECCIVTLTLVTLHLNVEYFLLIFMYVVGSMPKFVSSK